MSQNQDQTDQPNMPPAAQLEHAQTACQVVATDVHHLTCSNHPQIGPMDEPALDSDSPTAQNQRLQNQQNDNLLLAHPNQNVARVNLPAKSAMGESNFAIAPASEALSAQSDSDQSSMGQPTEDRVDLQTVRNPKTKAKHVNFRALQNEIQKTHKQLKPKSSLGRQSDMGAEGDDADEGPLHPQDKSERDSNFAELSKPFENCSQESLQQDRSMPDQEIIDNQNLQSNNEVHQTLPSDQILIQQTHQSNQIIDEQLTPHSQHRDSKDMDEDRPDVAHPQRIVRQCVKNTPNYSYTHKGITNIPNQDSSDKKKESVQEILKNGEESSMPNNVDIPKTLALESKPKSVSKRSCEDVIRIYQNMFSFDWELKDIVNLKHTPDREITPQVLWFYINSLYFPYNAQQLARVPFDQFAAPILENLDTVHSTEDLILPSQPDSSVVHQQNPTIDCENGKPSQKKANGVENPEPDVGMAQDPFFTDQQVPQNGFQHLSEQGEDGTEVQSVPELIQKLQIEENFNIFKDLLTSKLDQIDDNLGQNQQGAKDQNNDMAQDKLRLSDTIKLFKKELANLKKWNRDELRSQYLKFTEAYEAVEEKANKIIQNQIDDIERSKVSYKPTEIAKYPNLVKEIDPFYIADIKRNYEWYISNQNEVLLNVNYPSRQEKEFLRHIEQWQQEKNDLNYKRILQQLAESEDDPNCSIGIHGLDLVRYNSLSAHKRGLVVQEDAQCAICNNGDYEDEDLIVFCGNCNIPVHQRCYGIDEIPVNDWICNNCWAFNMRRGIMVKCILCPKRGGAMKPTSIFRSYEHFMRYHTAASKKKGLQHAVNFANLARDKPSQISSELNNDQELSGNLNSIHSQNEVSPYKNRKLQFFEREDKNHALSQILNREGTYQEALNQKMKEQKEAFPQEKLELHFLQSEAIAEIPEDYTFFLQRNEQRLEQGDIAPTETLYEWVHLSCAMWIPGPSVTPKTPVRMSKIDLKRFDLQCIICGKRNAGACIQCQYSRCMISFHIECARRSNYFLEVERIERERHYRVFCEKHRPLKIVRELEEKDKSTLDEVLKFSKIIERCTEINTRNEIKQERQKKAAPFSKPPVPQPPTKREIMAEKKIQKENQQKLKKQQKDAEAEAKRNARIQKQNEKIEKEKQRNKAKEQAAALIKAQIEAQSKAKAESAPPKWKEKDKRILYDLVKEKYIQLVKLRINVIKIDPMIKIKKKQDRLQKKKENDAKRVEKKRREKEIQKQQEVAKSLVKANSSAQRQGLRNRQHSNVVFQDVLEISMLSQQPSVDLENGDCDKDIDKSLNQDASLQQKAKNGAGPKDATEDVKSSNCDGQSVRPTMEEILVPESTEPYYKFGNPAYLQELDWAITFSKYDFPWNEIKFDKFTPKACYKMYTSSIRDAQAFLRKVLGSKDKYKKLVINQINEPPRIFFDTQNLSDPKPVESKQEAPVVANKKEELTQQKANESENEQFCKCRGEFKSFTGYFVACDGGEEECENGGWLHPECTTDLCRFTKEQIDQIDSWHCEDCVARMDKQSIKNIPKKNSQSTVRQVSRASLPPQLSQVSAAGEDIEISLEHTQNNFTNGNLTILTDAQIQTAFLKKQQVLEAPDKQGPSNMVLDKSVPQGQVPGAPTSQTNNGDVIQAKQNETPQIEVAPNNDNEGEGKSPKPLESKLIQFSLPQIPIVSQLSSAVQQVMATVMNSAASSRPRFENRDTDMQE